MVQSALSQDGLDDPFQLPTLVLEGTKTDRDFVKSPESVGVLTSEFIDEQGIDDLREGFNTLGNVRIFEGNRGENGFTIRGLNSEGFFNSSNNAPLTSVIIDGAIQSREATRRGARGLWDAEQVEVFRGPQSTLQGRGSLAGAVIIETKDPTYFWEGAGRVTFGELGRKDGAFALSGPIVQDQLAFRISGESRFRERDVSFTVPENKIIGEDEFSNIRGKLLWEPAGIPDLAVKLTLSRTIDKPGVNAVNGDFFDRVFASAPTTAVEIREADNFNAILEATYQFGNAELKSITSYIDSSTDISTPFGTTFNRVESRGGEDFSQDLILSFGDIEDRFSGVVGLFYGRFTLPRDTFVSTVFLGSPLVIQDFVSDDKTLSYSAYADFRWRFSPKFVLLAGGRYTHEEVTDESFGVTLSGPLNEFSSTDFSAFLPKVGLSYEITDFQTLSFTAQRGYRSGFSEIANVSSGPTGTIAGVVEVDPEFIWSYELAYRAEDPDGRWRFGATAFFAEYTDQQIVIPAALPALPTTENAGRSVLYGAELEGSYAFDNGLSISGSVGLLETEFRDFTLSTGDFAGNEFPEAPSLTASIALNYEHPSGFFASAIASYTDDYFSTGNIANTEKLRVDSFTRVDAQLGLKFSENVKVTFFVDNLFDEDNLTSLFATGPTADPIEATIADGRVFGFELEATF